MMKSKLNTRGFFLISLLCVFSLALSQSNGTTIYNFLTNNYSTRSAALGGNSGLYLGGADVQFDNPAGIVDVDTSQISANFNRFYLDFYGGALNYVFSPKSWGRYALGIEYLNYGEFEETDNLGLNTGGHFSASEMALVFSYANELVQDVYIGSSLKFISSYLAEYSSYGVALDLAFDWRPHFLNHGKILVSLSNTGTQLSTYNGLHETLPVSFKIGLSHKPEHLPITLGLMLRDLNYRTDDLVGKLKKFVLSAEFKMSKVIVVRLGFDNQKRIDLSRTGNNGFGGVSMGFGIKIKKFRLDYALGLMNIIGNTHNFGVVWVL